MNLDEFGRPKLSEQALHCLLNPKKEYEKIDTYKGYTYCIWLNSAEGYRTVYVSIPETSSIYQKGVRDIDICFNTDIPYFSYAGKLKSLPGWFLSWDYHHEWDGVDFEAIRNSYLDMPEIAEELIEYAQIVRPNSNSSFASLSNVENTCKELIDEIISRNI